MNWSDRDGVIAVLTEEWQEWLWQYVLPFVVIVASLARPLWEYDGAAPVLVWLFSSAPIMLFLSGLCCRPARVWIVPLGVILVFWVNGIVNLGNDGFALLVPLAILLGVPLTLCVWAGKAVRLLVEWWAA
jgi:hypothetical protein